jgi:hypothetical protein
VAGLLGIGCRARQRKRSAARPQRDGGDGETGRLINRQAAEVFGGWLQAHIRCDLLFTQHALALLLPEQFLPGDTVCAHAGAWRPVMANATPTDNRHCNTRLRTLRPCSTMLFPADDCQTDEDAAGRGTKGNRRRGSTSEPRWRKHRQWDVHEVIRHAEPWIYQPAEIRHCVD